MMRRDAAFLPTPDAHGSGGPAAVGAPAASPTPRARRGRLAALAAMAALVALGPGLGRPAMAAELTVLISGGYAAAFEKLAPAFERETGHHVRTVRGPSMGETPQAIPNRLRRGEPADVLIMADEALAKLGADGLADPATRTPLADSRIGLAVRAGAPRPDIGSVDALRQTLLAARAIAYSDSASGRYIEGTMLPRLGIAEALRGRARMIPAEPVAAVVARGDAEIGMQQISELLPVPGITIVGPLPDAVQKVTVFSAGVASRATDPAAALALIRYLSGPQVRETLVRTGLDPVAAKP